MARSGPEHPVVSLEKERERAIETLSQHFAQDNLSLEELERRIERVYQATSIQAVRDLTRDLPSEAEAPVPARRPAPVPPAFAPEYGRIVSFMAQTKRHGIWEPPRELKVVSVMSETLLDLTEAQLQPGVTEIRLRGLMTQLKVIVPRGVRVVLETSAFLSEIGDETTEPPPVGSGAPVVRITGRVVMSELKVFVRTREQPSGGDDDDDDLP